MEKKHLEKVFSFVDNGVLTYRRNLRQLWREYMRPAVKVLPSNPKISYLTKERCFLTQFMQD